MKMIKMWKYGASLLSMLGLLASLPIPVQAATGYEVSAVGFDPAVTAGQFISLNKLNQDLTVSWTAPTDATLVMSYLLKFSTSNTALTDQQLYDDGLTTHTYDYKVPNVQLSNIYPKSFFDTWDADQVRYLHIKTQYFSSSTVSYSDDVVVGPIKIDNVSATGQLTLVPTSGSSVQINVSLSPSEPLKYYWLSTASTFPGGTGNDYSLFPVAAFNLPSGTAYGAVNINAWFEDLAGNRSTSASATAVYTYTAPVSIVYNSSKINVGDSLGFTVDGTTAYNWTINVTSGTGVATFSGSSTGVASVTVVGNSAGTFTVTATPTSGTALTTGSIEVVQTYTKGDVNADAAIDSGDAILVLRYSVGLTTLTDTQKAAGNVTSKTSNSDIDSGDAIKILRYSVGLITAL